MTSKISRFLIPRRIRLLPSGAAVCLVNTVVFEATRGVAAQENASAPVTEPPAVSPNGSSAPAEMPSAEPSDSTKPKDKADRPRGLFGPFRIGPVVGIGLPNLLDFGFTTKLTRYFGAGFQVGLIPKFRISYYGDATLSFVEYDVYARAYPFGGSIFVGAGVGYATAKGTLASTYDLTPYQATVPSLPATYVLNSEGSVHTLVLTPEIGLFHTFDSGFSIGFDIGVQVPIAPSDVKLNLNLPAGLPQAVIDQFVVPTNMKVKNTLHTVGRTTIPTFGVFVGWLF